MRCKKTIGSTFGGYGPISAESTCRKSQAWETRQVRRPSDVPAQAGEMLRSCKICKGEEFLLVIPSTLQYPSEKKELGRDLPETLARPNFAAFENASCRVKVRVFDPH